MGKSGYRHTRNRCPSFTGNAESYFGRFFTDNKIEQFRFIIIDQVKILPIIFNDPENISVINLPVCEEREVKRNIKIAPETDGAAGGKIQGSPLLLVYFMAIEP